jgi:hypothetical protein
VNVKCPRCDEHFDMPVKLSSVARKGANLVVNVAVPDTAAMELHLSGHIEPCMCYFGDPRCTDCLRGVE